MSLADCRRRAAECHRMASAAVREGRTRDAALLWRMAAGYVERAASLPEAVAA